MESNKQQFTALVKRHKETIYSVCLMFADNQDDANDLMQEVLIKLWKGFDSFRGECSEKSWIWRISMNTCITQDQKLKHKQDVPVAELLTEQTAESKQVKMLHDRIHRLQPFDRAIVMLWLEDLSYEEIGQIVGITAKNVSVRLVRIKEELKKMNN